MTQKWIPCEVSISGGFVILLSTDSCNDRRYSVKISVIAAGFEIFKVFVRTKMVSDEIGRVNSIDRLKRFSSFKFDFAAILSVTRFNLNG